jgi:hypothetical protein
MDAPDAALAPCENASAEMWRFPRKIRDDHEVEGAPFRFTRNASAMTFPVTAWSQGREKRSIMETRKKNVIPTLTVIS